jgi:hypothetical protein
MADPVTDPRRSPGCRLVVERQQRISPGSGQARSGTPVVPVRLPGGARGHPWVRARVRKPNGHGRMLRRDRVWTRVVAQNLAFVGVSPGSGTSTTHTASAQPSKVTRAPTHRVSYAHCRRRRPSLARSLLPGRRRLAVHGRAGRRGRRALAGPRPRDLGAARAAAAAGAFQGDVLGGPGPRAAPGRGGRLPGAGGALDGDAGGHPGRDRAPRLRPARGCSPRCSDGRARRVVPAGEDPAQSVVVRWVQ